MKRPEHCLRLLYMARTFPPVVGGMEALALRLSGALSAYADVTVVANRRGKKWIPAFMPYALARALWLITHGRADAVLLGDAVMGPVGRILKRVTGIPVAATVHGLDLTFPNRLYQTTVLPALSKLDMAFPNSRATEETLLHRAPGTPSTVIPLGVNPLPEPSADTVRDFRDRLSTNGRPLMLTTGRLIKRKGVAWFVEYVLPALPQAVTYAVIGSGAEMDAVRAAARRAGVEHRVQLLGRVSDEELSAAYRSADVFVMPNVPVPGDMEGFGLVALEAASAALPVVASRLEGITEAVQHERNGILVAPQMAQEFSAALHKLFAASEDERREIGERFRVYTLEHYSWDRTARRYVEVIRGLVQKKNR